MKHKGDLMDRPARTPAGGTAAGLGDVSMRSRHDRAWLLVFLGWVIATAATLGALFFSEIMELPPCLLCWYQRIFMFPLVLLLPLGLFPFDPKIVRYALPLALVGTAIAVYHELLVTRVIPESASACTRGVPCAEIQFEWLGFVTIPFLSVVAFTSIVALLVMAHFQASK
jgi:disulfide bond formation protein DsbB